jgi:hypothetical protein
MSDNKFKYYCEKCDLGCNIISRWEAHIKTEKHLTGQRKKRSDYKKPHKCDKCDYETKNITTMKMHKLNYHSDKEERENEFKYYCKECDYGCFYEEIINKHYETTKHKYNMTLVK